MKYRHSFGAGLVAFLCVSMLIGDLWALKSRTASRSRSSSSFSSAAASRSPWVNQFEMGGYAGWMLAGELPALSGDLVFVNDWTYGGQLDFSVAPGSQIELQFGRLDSRVDRKQFGQLPVKLTDIAIQFYQIGGIYEPVPWRRFKPFISGTLGATHFMPSDARYSSELLFSFSLGLGFKFFLHPNFGIRAQARLLAPVYFESAAFLCGSGGCLGFIEAGVPMAQGDFTGGLFVAF